MKNVFIICSDHTILNVMINLLMKKVKSLLLKLHSEKWYLQINYNVIISRNELYVTVT